MRNALLFDDVIQFTDFIRVYGNEAFSSRGFTLYQVRDPERPAHTQLILVGFRRKKGWSFADTPLTLKELQVEEKSGKLQGRYPSKPRFEMELLDKSMALYMLELISLMEWREEPPMSRMIFWLRDPALMPRLVTDSFRLHNDRVQFAPIENKGRTEMLLRIELPSYYLLQWCQEQHQGAISLFYSPAEDLYVEWGYTHPLEDIWRRSHQPRKSEWLFFRKDAPREHITPPQWQDIYKATEFVLDFPVEEAWTAASEFPVSFSLPLRFEPRARPLEPELWMLEEEEQYLLERLLSLVDEEDLKTLLISIQEDEEGKRRFFIREKHLGEGRKFLDFKGRRFASYKGFHNLLLPISLELQPQLRRDQYRSLFSLQNGELTVLSTEGQEDQKAVLQKTQLLKLRESSFEPITKLIDYIVESESNQLTNILQKTMFDFSHYAKAPRREDLLDRPKGSKGAKSGSEKDSGKEKSEGLQDLEPAKKLRKKRIKKKVVKTKTQDDEGTQEEIHIEPSELEKEEARIERVIVIEGQDPDSWQELSEIKELLGKANDATTAALEGMWLVRGAPEYDEERTRLLELLDAQLALKGNPGQRLKRAKTLAEKSEDPLAVAAFVFHGQHEGEDRIDAWLQDATTLLRASEDKMRKKERWLVWREIFQRNGDVREMARVRELILNDLNENGITNHDVPMFIQERLFQERWLQPNDGENDESTSEVGAAYRNLEQISGTVEQFPLPRLKAPGLAILGHAYAKIGHHPRAKEMLDEAQKCLGTIAELDKHPDIAAWTEMFTYRAIAWQSKGEGANRKRSFDALVKELEKKNRNHASQLQKMETSLEERKELENLSEYLSKENSKRLFPSSTSSASAPIKARLDAIETSYQAGELQLVGKEVVGVLEYIRDELTTTKKSPDFRTLAWLLDSAINTLSKLKWGNEGRELIREFENFVSTIPQQPPKDSAKLSDFYFTLLHLAMSEGLIALGSEPFAIQHLQELLAWTFDRHLVPLDYVDMCSKALNTIEAAQLKNRQDPLRLIMQGMLRQLTSKGTGTSYDNASFAAIALKLLDQTVEVALSKEKLTLGLYKQYTDQDELLIRERIFTEDACAKA